MSTKSFAFCPVSDLRINERVARLNAAFTVLLLLVFVVTGNIIPVAILALDFFLRAFEFSRYSPFTLSSKQLVRVFRLSKNLINAGPKLFAARIGLLFSVGILASELFALHTAALSLTAILALFSFLESAFGICVACEIYPFVYRTVYRK